VIKLVGHKVLFLQWN